MKQEEQRRRQKRAPGPVPFAFIRGLRGHSELYIPFCRLPFVYFFSFSRMSIFLTSFSPLFHSPVFGIALHRARMFVPTMLYHPAIISHTCHSPSVSLLPPSVIPPTLAHHHPFPLSRHYHAAFCKIYVCRRAGDVAAGYLFFQ